MSDFKYSKVEFKKKSVGITEKAFSSGELSSHLPSSVQNDCILEMLG